MGYQNGFGCDKIDITRYGFWFNPHHDAMDPTFMAYNLDAPPFVEPWGQGLVVFHNSVCKHPLPHGFFVNAVQGYIKDGKLVTDHFGWHPITTKTRTIYLGPDKEELNKLPWRQSPRVAVGAILRWPGLTDSWQYVALYFQ